MMKRIVIAMLGIGMFVFGGGIQIPVAFQADFLQKVTNPKKKVILYRGTVTMKAPSMLKWIYREPTRKEVCSDGKEVLVVDHDLEQATTYRMQKRFDLAAVLRSARPYREGIYVARYNGRNYTIAVDAEGRVSQIAYHDDMDNVVNIHFQHVRYLKKAPSDRKLRCTVPGTYDRIGG